MFRNPNPGKKKKEEIYRMKNRWLVLFSSIIINMCLGSAYAWSVFQKPLIAIFKWTTGEANLAFTISLSIIPVAMIIAGKIQDRQGPKMVIMVGGLLFGAGIIGAGFTDSLGWLYMTYGLLGGVGIGAAYACTIANTVKWFPDKRGLAGGLIAAGFGAGAIVFAPLGAQLVAAQGVLGAFKILGIIYAVAVVLAAFMVDRPPAGYKPEGWNPPPPSASSIVSGVDKNWGQMLSDPMFYVLWAMYTIGCISGLMIIGHASPIGQEMVKLNPQTAAIAISFLAIANTFGRVFWGFVSDKIGRYNSLMAMYVVAGAAMYFLSSVGTFEAFVIVLMLIGVCFGGFLGTFPAITADMFGAKNLGMNYGIIFTAYGLAAFIGPRMASLIKEANKGDYSQAFLIAAALSIAGVLLTLFASYKKKKMAAA